MKLDEITSLVFLQIKAKEDKYYRQLAVIVAKYYNGANWDEIVSISGKPVSDDLYFQAIERLELAASRNRFGCKGVCGVVNDFRIEVKFEPKDIPKPVKRKASGYTSNNLNYWEINLDK